MYTNYFLLLVKLIILCFWLKMRVGLGFLIDLPLLFLLHHLIAIAVVQYKLILHPFFIAVCIKEKLVGLYLESILFFSIFENTSWISK